MSAGADFAFSAFILVAGVFSGSALWWLALSGGVGILRGRFNTETMRWVNRVAGVVILVFAALMLWRALDAFL